MTASAWRALRPLALGLLLLGLGETTGAVAETGSRSRIRVVIVPLGATAPDLVEQVATAVRDRFAFEVGVAAAVPLAPAAWYGPRKRWRAEKLLDQLDALDLGEVEHVIGLTEQPISTTKGARLDWGIAGLGQLPGKSCVLTSYLFRGIKKKDRARYRRYMENLVLHELGHTLNLPHCPLDRCIMADAKGDAFRAARLSSNEYCPRCHRTIQHLLRDPAPRGTWSARERAQVGVLGSSP